MSVDAPALKPRPPPHAHDSGPARRYIGAPKATKGKFQRLRQRRRRVEARLPAGRASGVVQRRRPSPAAAVTFYGLLAVKRTATEADIKPPIASWPALAPRCQPRSRRHHDVPATGRAYEVPGDPNSAAATTPGSSSRRRRRPPNAPLTADYWRPPPPLRLAFHVRLLAGGRFHARDSRLAGYHRRHWRTLVTAWPMGADTFEEIWV